MSYNLANRSSEERQAIEAEKSRLFEYWQLNNERAKVEAGKLAAEKGKRKGAWQTWCHDQIDAMSPPEFQSLVRREVAKL